MQTLRELTERILHFRDARNWKQFHNPKDMAISLSLEAAELVEHFQWCSEEDLSGRVSDRKEAIGEELADVLYWVLLMSHDFGIDVGEAFVRKMAKNEQKYPVEEFRDSARKYDERS